MYLEMFPSDRKGIKILGTDFFRELLFADTYLHIFRFSLDHVLLRDIFHCLDDHGGMGPLRIRLGKPCSASHASLVVGNTPVG